MGFNFSWWPFVIIVSVMGWAIIEFVLWLLSFVSISFGG